jgi:hypothetical protein
MGQDGESDNSAAGAAVSSDHPKYHSMVSIQQPLFEGFTREN